MSAVTGWSAQMDRKIEAMLRDPERHFAEARAEARRSSSVSQRRLVRLARKLDRARAEGR